jgi:hypothetical protein
MHGVRYFRDQFHRSPDRQRLAPHYFVKLAAFNELHAEVALAIAFANVVNGNDAWMIQAGSGLRLTAKALQVRFGGPRAEANHFERDGTIETFLMGAINYALSAPANFLEQFVIAEVCEHTCRSVGPRFVVCPRAIITHDITRLSPSYSGPFDPSYRFVVEQTKPTF